MTFTNSTSTSLPATATAPLAGAFSPDNSIFFVSTAGDNEIHFISIPPNLSTSPPPTDTQQSAPICPLARRSPRAATTPAASIPTAPSSTTYVPATVIAVKPRSVT